LSLENWGLQGDYSIASRDPPCEIGCASAAAWGGAFFLASARREKGLPACVAEGSSVLRLASVPSLASASVATAAAVAEEARADAEREKRGRERTEKCDGWASDGAAGDADDDAALSNAAASPMRSRNVAQCRDAGCSLATRPAAAAAKALPPLLKTDAVRCLRSRMRTRRALAAALASSSAARRFRSLCAATSLAFSPSSSAMASSRPLGMHCPLLSLGEGFRERAIRHKRGNTCIN